MNGSDGKKAAITASDDEMTLQKQMMWIIKTIENPKSNDEFVNAAKIHDPKASETKLRKRWKNYKIK